MGIKDINKLTKRHAPDAFFTLPINLLSGKRIAIDGPNWMYTNMAIARKKVINRTDIATQELNPIEIRREWFLAALNFITGWLSYNITPVFVFDGQHLADKDDTKAKRRDARVATRAKIEALYKQLDGDILERPGNIIEELRKELRNYNFISSEDFELFKMVIKGIGIPCLQATGDGEQLCSALCVDRKVAGVFSADTDNLVFGCPLVINGFSETCSYDEYGNRVAHLDCVRLDRILDGLKMSHSLFVDLCIMCGCDFNTNMPGYASIKSYGLLQKHGSIDDLPRNLNTECLKHIRCREIFKYIPSQELIVETPDEYDHPELGYGDLNITESNGNNGVVFGPLDINKRAITTARDYLEMAGISGQIERIIASYHQVTPSSDGYIESLSLGDPPHYVPPPQRVTLNIITRSPTVPIANNYRPNPMVLIPPPMTTVPMPIVAQPILASHVKDLTLNIVSQSSNY